MDDCTFSSYTNRALNNEKVVDVETPIFWCQTCMLQLYTPYIAVQHITGRSHQYQVKLKNNCNTISHVKKDDGIKRKLDADTVASSIEKLPDVIPVPATKKNKTEENTSLNCGNLFFNSHPLKPNDKCNIISDVGNNVTKQKLGVDSVSSGCIFSSYTNRARNNEKVVSVEAPIFWCQTCMLQLNTPYIAAQHITGHSHKVKLKNNCNTISHAKKDGVMKRKLDVNTVASAIVEKPPDVAKPLNSGRLFCNVCNIALSSVITSELHFSGKKHAKAVAKSNQPNQQKVALEHCERKNAATDFCYDCGVELFSELQTVQHFNGRQHKINMGILPNQYYDDPYGSYDNGYLPNQYNDPYESYDYESVSVFGGFGKHLRRKNKVDWSIWGRGATLGRFNKRGTKKTVLNKVKNDDDTKTKAKKWRGGKVRGKRGRKMIHGHGAMKTKKKSKLLDNGSNTGPAHIPGARQTLSSYFVHSGQLG